MIAAIRPPLDPVRWLAGEPPGAVAQSRLFVFPERPGTRASRGWI